MPNIAIIGGGIGGLCAAIALQQRGLEAHVYEAAPKLQPVGAGIWVPTNAIRVLDRLGLGRPVARDGVALERVELRDVAGGVLQQVDLNEVRDAFGHTTISIHRGALQRVLVDHLQPDTLHLGKTCTAVEERDGCVRAHFDDATHTEAALCIGADGIRSTVRHQLFSAARLRYSGQTCYRGVADLRLPAPLARTAREVWGAGQRFGFSVIDEMSVYWFAPLDAKAGETPPGNLKRDLLHRYAAFPDPTIAILDHTPRDTIIQTDLYDLRPLDHWWQGRVVLLGDAAHAPTPNLGQGAAQAIEDAYVLAKCLPHHEAPPDAFSQYETERKARANRIVRRSWWLGQMAHLSNPVARRLRNAVLRATPAFIQRRELETLYGVSY